MRVLVVEDSDRLRGAIAAGLGAAGLAVDTAPDGRAALPYLDAMEYDVIVLDVMMPRMDGITLLREIRRRKLPVRVLVLSARDAVADRVDALEIGADDYLVKPFAFDELRARVLALARRAHAEPSALLELGGLELDIARRVARGPGGALTLTPKEYALLETLARNPGRVLSRAQLFESIYSSDSESSDKVIEVLMSNLRGKLARAGLPELIQTRRGFGYVAG